MQQGALFSYTENIREVGRAAASAYVDKILKGAKPAETMSTLCRIGRDGWS